MSPGISCISTYAEGLASVSHLNFLVLFLIIVIAMSVQPSTVPLKEEEFDKKPIMLGIYGQYTHSMWIEGGNKVQ